MSITGEPDGDPVKIGVPMCDLVCALYGALAVVSALRVRDETQEGQYIDVSLFEAGVSFAVWEAGKYFATGEIPKPLGSAHQSTAPYQAIRSADGFFTVGATSPPNWRAFCKALGLDRLTDDERYQDNAGRHHHREGLIQVIESVTKTQPTSHWIGLLEVAGVPCSPIQDYGEVFADEQLVSRNFFWDAPHPILGNVRQLGSPMRFSKSVTRRDKAGPMFGEHSSSILSELGYSKDRIDDLLARHVIKGPGATASGA